MWRLSTCGCGINVERGSLILAVLYLLLAIVELILSVLNQDNVLWILYSILNIILS